MLTELPFMNMPYHKMAIPDLHPILDVGCKNNPYPEADVLADICSKEESGLKDDRPFYQTSIEAMPFADKQFAIVIASHVIEHANDPVSACRELVRVARRGYLEFPTPLAELMFNVGTDNWEGPHRHLWYVWREENYLCFAPIPPPDKKAKRLVSDELMGGTFDTWVYQNPNRANLTLSRLLWEEQLLCRTYPVLPERFLWLAMDWRREEFG